jgi:type IV pilus assembly protein PilM
MNGNTLLLYRTVDLPVDPALRVEEVQRGIAVAAAYFEDKLLVRPTRLHYAGIGAADNFARVIADPELEVVDLAPRPETGAVTALGNLSIAPLTGALAGAH